MKRFILACSIMLCASTLLAYDFEKNGVYYNITSFSDLTAEVTYRTGDYASYSGHVSVPASVVYGSNEYTVTSIGFHAFSRSIDLEEVSLPQSIQTIGKFAFENCTSLTNITIPSQVTLVDDFAFFGCNTLSKIRCRPVVPPVLGSDNFTTFQYHNIHLDVSSPDSYMTADGWKDFYNVYDHSPNKYVGDINNDGYISAGDITTLVEMVLRDEYVPYKRDTVYVEVHDTVYVEVPGLPDSSNQSTFCFTHNGSIIPNGSTLTISEYELAEAMEGVLNIFVMQSGLAIKNVSGGDDKVSLHAIGIENFSDIQICPDGNCRPWIDGEITADFKDKIPAGESADCSIHVSYMDMTCSETLNYKGSIKLEAYNYYDREDYATITLVFDTSEGE